MNALQVNPVTGFLESSNLAANAFTSEKKVAFLQMAKKYVEVRQLPDVGKICQELTMSYAAFHQHLQRDAKFREAWEELKMRNYSGLANELSIKANSKNGIIANIAVLKYLERGKFSDDLVTPHQDYQQLKDVFSANNQAIDAEIVDNAPITSTRSNQCDNSTNVSDVKRDE